MRSLSARPIRRTRAGMTLMEIMVVGAIIAGVFAIALPSTRGKQEDEKVKSRVPGVSRECHEGRAGAHCVRASVSVGAETLRDSK